MKKLILLLFMVVIIIPGFSQLTLPDSYKLETKEDFDSYEEKIIDCINWYFTVPLDEEPEFRANLKAFVMIWLTENPSIKIIMDEDILTPIFNDSEYEHNTDITFAYLLGMASYILDNDQEDYTQADVQYAGVMSMLLLFQNNMEILCGSRGLEAYLILKDTNELRNWVENSLKGSEE
jgi:hypothetical protein